MIRKATSSTEDAFLQTILERPDDDMPRLVFADWLEERGDPRGAFIRLQCQRAGLTRHDPPWKEILSQESALLKRHEAEWSKPILRLVDEVEYRKGFIEHVGATAVKFLQNADRLFRLTPIRHVKLTRLGSLLSQIADSPHLAKIASLNLSHNGSGIGNKALQTLVRSSRITGLRALRLFDCALGPASAEVLAGAPHLNELQALEMGNNALGDEGARSLANSPHLAQLRELSLCSNQLSHAGVSALASAPVARLTHLDLGGNQFGNGFGSDGVAALVMNACCADLKRLMLGENAINSVGIEALARSEHLGRLEHLDLHGNRVTDRGIQALAASTNLPQLAYLNLENNEFGPSAARTLASSPNYPRMRQLLLGRHGAARK